MKNKNKKETKMKKTPEMRAAQKQQRKQEFTDFFTWISQSRNTIFAYFAIYLLLAALSLFLTDWGTKADFRTAVFDIVTRALSLLLVTFFGFLTNYGKSFFAGGATVWTCWMCVVSGVATGKIIVAGIVGIVCTVLVVLFEKKPENMIKPSKKVAEYIYFFYILFGLTVLVEFLQRLDFIAPFEMLIKTPDIFMLNFEVILFTGAFILLARRKKVGLVIFSVIWLALAFISILKVNNVYEPLTILDIFATVDMCAVVLKYFTWYFFVLLVAAVVGIVVLIVWLIKKEKANHITIGRKIIALFLCVAFALSYGLTCKLSYTQFTSNRIIENYYTQGFASSILRYTLNSTPEKPEETETLNLSVINQKIEESFPENDNMPTAVNVVVVQMESFCDPYVYLEYNEDLTYEYDPIPFIHSLKQNYTSGTVSVPVFAGQTCKSEFEFLSGVNLDTLPGGYNPYVTSLNGTTQIDSLARYFDEIGYTTTAIHNYQGEFFSRSTVYKNLGFDTFIPVECMSDVERRGNSIWAGDNVLAEQISKALDNKNEDDTGSFVFNVSMQLHGSYPVLDESEWTMEIGGLEDDENLKGKLAYYVKELENFDKAIESIVTMLSERDEPTILLLYADHQPQITRDLCADMSNEDIFTTNYIVWDNLGLEKTDETVELYELSTLLCDKLGVDGGYMNKFNRLYDAEDTEAQEIVGYSRTFDVTDFTNETYKIGLAAPEIKDVSENVSGSGLSNVYEILGTGITEDTVCVVNGKVYDLEYVDSGHATLSMNNKTLSEGDEISLRIIGERQGEVFCEGEKYLIK